MKKFTATVSAAALVALTAPAGMASSILIDDFSTFQRVVDVPFAAGEENTNDEPGIGDFGALRTMTIASSGGNQASSLTSTGSSSGFTPPNVLQIANSPTASSVATVSYDFAGPPVDLTMSGTNNKFFFEFPLVNPFDLLGSKLTTTVHYFDGVNTVSSSVTEDLDEFTSPFTNFSAFSVGTDFENVTSLAFSFDAVTDFDGTLNSISVVPLPASALLLLGGLGGLAGLGATRRRRRKGA